MTRERINGLLDLVDQCNEKLNLCASFEHCKFDDCVRIVMFYAGKGCGRVFSTYYIGPETEVYADKDLIKAEAFMRMLLAAAEHCEVMRRER